MSSTKKFSGLASGRRLFIKSLGLGAVAAALPALTVKHAYALATQAAGNDGRFILLFLRGGMDGLFAIAPVSDPALPSLRPNISRKTMEQGISLAGTGSPHTLPARTWLTCSLRASCYSAHPPEPLTPAAATFRPKIFLKSAVAPQRASPASWHV